jgi:hypothetical protein
MTVTKPLMIHAEAAASCGEAARAGDDVCTLLRLAAGLGREPTMIDSIVSFSVISMAIRPQWSILKRQAADEALLARINLCLKQIDVRTMATAALRGELVDGAQAGDMLSKAPYVAWDVLTPSSKGTLAGKIEALSSYALIQLNPRAAALGNKAVVTDLMLTHVIEPVEKHGLQEFYQQSMLLTKREALQKLAPDVLGVIAWQILPTNRSFAGRALLMAARVNQACIACALERYFIKHQSYPESLTQLVPEYLPNVPIDPIDEHPMRYRQEGGRYRLWSLGFDGIDDGGVVKGGPMDDPLRPRLGGQDYEGDWVWSYERLVPPAPKKKPALEKKRRIGLTAP